MYMYSLRKNPPLGSGLGTAQKERGDVDLPALRFGASAASKIKTTERKATSNHGGRANAIARGVLHQEARHCCHRTGEQVRIDGLGLCILRQPCSAAAARGGSMCRQKNFGTVCTCCMMCAWMRRFLAGGTTARSGWNQSMGYQSVLTLIRLLPWCSVVAHPCPSRRGISKSCCRLNKKIRVFHYSNSRLLCFSISSPPQW